MTGTDLKRALDAFNTGRYSEARAHLAAFLRAEPRHANALHLAGMVEHAAQQYETALSYYDRALTNAPEHAGAHYSKALLLTSLGRHSQAMPHHDAAVRLAPGNVWAWVNRGNSYAALGEFKAAVADYDQALKIKPGLPDALTNKGNSLSQQGLYTEALVCFDEAIQLHAQHAQAWISRCHALTKLERHDEAIASATQALKLQPQHPEAWVRKGIALQELEKCDEALANIEKAIEIHPQYAEAWSAHGDILRKLSRYSEAVASYDKCLAFQPHLSQTYFKKARALQGLGEEDHARSCYEHAIELAPDNVDAHMNLSLVLLKQHDYVRGWEEYEYRWRSMEQPLHRLTTSRPIWMGAASTAAVLLWGEQGIGDQILHASILPQLASFPQRKLVALDKRLIPLFERSLPDFEYLDSAQISDALDFSVQLPLGSLPRLFRPTKESFSSARHPYLIADTPLMHTLRGKIERPGKLVCGVAWSSNRKDVGEHKSISLKQMLTALASTHLHFVNLQYGDTFAERASLKQAHGIEIQNVDEIDNYNNIDGLASLIQACDIVITTSNSTAHLAGALGKMTFLLLPLNMGRLWYWAEHGGKNLWYPSVHTFFQNEPGQWIHPLQAIKSHLEKKTWD